MCVAVVWEIYILYKRIQCCTIVADPSAIAHDPTVTSEHIFSVVCNLRWEAAEVQEVRHRRNPRPSRCRRMSVLCSIESLLMGITSNSSLAEQHGRNCASRNMIRVDVFPEA